MRFKPNFVDNVGMRFIAERPHIVKKSFRQSHLHAFRFDSIIEDRQQI